MMTPSMSSPNKGPAARRVALTGLLAALALIFSYVEVLFPFNAGIPGIKLGLANLVPLIIMYRLDARYAFAANLIRVLLAGSSSAACSRPSIRSPAAASAFLSCTCSKRPTGSPSSE